MDLKTTVFKREVHFWSSIFPLLVGSRSAVIVKMAENLLKTFKANSMTKLDSKQTQQSPKLFQITKITSPQTLQTPSISISINYPLPSAKSEESLVMAKEV
jgi:hypothetical protein